MPAHARQSRGALAVVTDTYQAWRDWRRSRPFWGALIVIAGSAEIIWVRMSLPVSSPATIVPAGLLIAAALLVCAGLLLFDPVHRSGYATVAILLAILALTTSHLGGYLLGTLLCGAGGALAWAWVPEMTSSSGRPLKVGPPPGFTLIRGAGERVPDDPGQPADRRRAARPDHPGHRHPAAPASRGGARRSAWPQPADDLRHVRSEGRDNPAPGPVGPRPVWPEPPPGSRSNRIDGTVPPPSPPSPPSPARPGRREAGQARPPWQRLPADAPAQAPGAPPWAWGETGAAPPHQPSRHQAVPHQAVPHQAVPHQAVSRPPTPHQPPPVRSFRVERPFRLDEAVPPADPAPDPDEDAPAPAPADRRDRD